MEGSAESLVHTPKAASVKALLESSGSTSIPSTYSYSTLHHYEPNTASEPEETIPIIDFSLLTSCDPHQRSKAIHQLSKACEEWGFFTLVNHGVPKSLMEAVIEGCFEFFNMTLKEKQEFSSNDMWSPVRFGTSIDVKVDQKICLWRDFLKVFVHPHFNFPNKPKGFSEVAREYSTQIRELVLELLKGISEGLGLEECYIEKAMDLERGFQLFAVNFYPRCPQPELAMGIPPHTDYGLLTCLISNGIDGLQILRDGKWHNVKSLPDSILINVADQLEILSNGRCRSDRHRAVVNNNATRISIAMAHGPSIDKIVGPAPELVDMESRPSAFVPMEFKKYVELNHANPIDAPPYFEQLRPENAN